MFSLLVGGFGPPEPRRLPECIEAEPWHPKIKWKPYIRVQANTYQTVSLFDVEPSGGDVTQATPAQRVTSPCDRWCYVEKQLPKGTALSTYRGAQRGLVAFDADVIVPTLHERDRWGQWNKRPWMSLTPMEILTLRSGVRFAKGDVVVCGLGLGHQLIEVSRKKTVKRLRLVEKDQGLVDWLPPKIRPHLGRELSDVIVGDVFEELPEVECDVALVDVFESYGNNDWERDRLRRTCRNVGHVWAWGSAVV